MILERSRSAKVFFEMQFSSTPWTRVANAGRKYIRSYNISASAMSLAALGIPSIEILLKKISSCIVLPKHTWELRDVIAAHFLCLRGMRRVGDPDL